MKTKTLALAIILIALIFSACGRTPVQPDTTPLVFSTLTRMPTRTKAPTWTRISTSTWIPISTEIPTPTTDPVNLEIESFPGKFTGCEIYSAMLSPDNNWLAQDCGYDGVYRVSNRDGSVQWSITRLEAFGPADEFNPKNLGSIQPIHWSSDSQIIYFETEECCGGDGANMYEIFGMPLLAYPIYRLNVQNGIWTKIVPDQNYYSFSPTGRRLVFFNRSNWNEENSFVNINIMDLKTGQVIQKSLEQYPAAAYVVWSRDGKRLAFTAIQRVFDWTNFSLTLFEMEGDTGNLSALHTFEASTLIYSPISWSDDNVITIQIIKAYSNNEVAGYQYFNSGTNLFVSPTPTP
jgi:hypothetical protein